MLPAEVAESKSPAEVAESKSPAEVAESKSPAEAPAEVAEGDCGTAWRNFQRY